MVKSNNVTYTVASNQVATNNGQLGAAGNGCYGSGNNNGISLGSNSSATLTCAGCNNHILNCICSQIYGLYPNGNGNIYPTNTGGNTLGGSLGGNFYPNTTGTVTITLPYRSIKAPRKGDCPLHVYFNGRLLTVGILGSDVECAFTGEHFVFSPGTAEYYFSPCATMVIEYNDEIYNYKVETPDTKNRLNAKLQSVICKQK